MSIGFDGMCQKFVEDNDCIIYSYCAYDLNEPEFINEERIFDGIILIDRSCLIAPEIRKKIRRMPSVKRKIYRKIIFRDVDIDDFIEVGKVQIENCSHTWKCLPDGTDFIAYRLCNGIFKHYHENGSLPVCIGVAI